MRLIVRLGLCVMALALAGCQRAPQAAGTKAGANTTDRVQQWVLPASAGSAEPGLVATSDGRLLLSWIDSVRGRRRALQFAAWGASGSWQSAARTIAVGNSLVADGANPPRLVITPDAALWVSWLQRSQQTGEVLQLSRSADGGFNWSAPVAIAATTDSSDLGFISLWPQARTSVGAAWLGGGPARSDAAGNGPVTSLHAATFDQNLRSSANIDVDGRVCDCCHTSAAVTSRGTLLVYRDRTEGEIRDIAAARFDGSKWTSLGLVHRDGWHMPACPVNGPSVAALGNQAVLAWYTAANDQPSVQLARSESAGDRFSAPVVVDHGNAVLGRVAVALDAQQVWVSWMREDAGAQSLWIARYTPDLSRQLQRLQVATLAGRGRVTGFPQLALQAGHAFVVWTDTANGDTQLRGATIAP